MNILIVNCHWGNRGDESAIRAMIDELLVCYPNANIKVQMGLGSFYSFPQNDRVKTIPTFPGLRKRRLIFDLLSVYSNGLINLSKESKIFFDVLKKTDLVIHAPGGPSIGDLYISQEKYKLWRLDLIRKRKIPYIFYAPSMGPFHNKARNRIRKRVIEQAAIVCLREEISEKMVNDFVPKKKTIVTLDSAFQHPINMNDNLKILQSDASLFNFLGTGDNVIGLTITDLMWNSQYKGDSKVSDNIRITFTKFVDYLIKKNYKVLFIPQLFGNNGDKEYMKTFCKNDCYVLNDKYDCYFQQYVIGKIKAVVGMRYHSNIFSAKMGTPFVSVSYEQKMLGFMKKAELTDYCLDIQRLSVDSLIQKFELLEENYNSIKSYLFNKKEDFIKESHKTTDLVVEYIDKKIEV